SSLWNASQIPYLTQPSQTWLSGWQYRIPITIRENSGNTLTDYQILVTNPIYNESGLISSWHFNEGSGTIAFDSSGNNNNGNLVNDPTWADGKFGRALNFDGTNDYVISSTGISPPSTFTVNVWIYYTGDNGVVVDWLGQANINTGYHASGIEIVGGTVRVRYWNLPCVNLGSITPNNWYMITLVYDGNNLKGYINGEFKGSTSGALSHPSTLYIALAAADSTNCGDGSYFAGKIDEFRFYNRALSDVEIQALYQAKARLDYGDIRFTDSDGVSLLNYWQEADGKFWVKVPNIPANSNKIIYLYYGNPNANSMSNGDLVFTESGTLFITRYSTADPQNLSEALVAWNAAPQTTGYCTRYLSSFVNINNRGTNGCGGAYSNIAFYIEAFFYVDVAGTWSFRHGPDYGRGGGLYLDNSPLEEAWTSNLWWNGNWGSDSVLDGSKTLSVGWHRLVSFGFEDCCDGGQTIQFLRPGSAWADWSTTNLNIKSRKYVSPEPTISVGNEEIRNYEQIYLYLSNYIFSYKLGNSQWINETYRFPSWQYRISITINNTQNSNTLIDYQILVTINTQNLISQGKMRNDCGDIRFTDSDEITLLNYWIEDGCNTTNTKIWVKVPDIPANSNKIIYLYYGNPEATSMSNGDLVFEFFDDFLGTSLNTNKWIAYSNDYTISNGILRINKGGIERTTAFPFNIQDGYIVETKVRHHEYLLYGKSGVLPSIGSSPYTAKNNDNADATIIYVRGCVLFIFCNTYYYIGDGSTNSFNVADGEGIDEVTENNAWYITGISVNGGVIRFWYNGEVKTTITGVNWAKNLKYVKLGSYLRNANYEIQDTSYDWIRIRKYTPLEPTISLGNEEITSMLPFTAWANVTKSFSQPGTLCWKFYANNTLNLWNVTQDSCLN
ncbi:MAG: CCXG family PEP-CTERM protein, partial [Candidatus Methanomethylicia archaeon]